MPVGQAPYGVADARPATQVVVNPNGSGPQFKKAQVHSAGTMSSMNFVFDTETMAKPGQVLSYGKNTMSTQFGARAGDPLSNPAGT